MNLDGTERKTLFTGKSRTLFSVSWAHSGNLIAFSHGVVFGSPKDAVNVYTIRPDGTEKRALTPDTGNKAEKGEY